MKELPLEFTDPHGPEKIGDWDYLAHQLAEHEKWDQAANSLQKAAEADPHQLQRWLTIANWRRRCGQVPQAIVALSRALDLARNNEVSKSTFTPSVSWSILEQITLWAELAYLYAQDSRWPECEQACMEVLERDPAHLQVTELMAEACLQTQHLEAAEQLLQTLLRRAPLDPWFRLRYATLLQMQGKLGDAQRELLRLQSMPLHEQLKMEVNKTIDYLDEMQFQQIIALLQNTPDIQTSVARAPQQRLEELGFCLTEPTIEMLQNVLWEHFGQSPYQSLEKNAPAPRLH